MTAARRRPAQPAQTGLWGRAEPLPTPAPARAEVNDLDLIAAVIRAAEDPGYVLIGPAERVHIREAGTKHDVTRVPTYEADAVAQLLGSGHFTIGGTHIVKVGRREGPARSVLVTSRARSMVRRWASLTPLHRGTGATSTGRAELWCPECSEPAVVRPPRRWVAANGPRPAHSHPDGEPLCPVMTADGYRPAQPTRSRPA